MANKRALELFRKQQKGEKNGPKMHRIGVDLDDEHYTMLSEFRFPVEDPEKNKSRKATNSEIIAAVLEIAMEERNEAKQEVESSTVSSTKPQHERIPMKA